MITNNLRSDSFVSSRRPLPLGEGWGEGLAHTTTPTFLSFSSVLSALSTWPSHRRRRNNNSAYRILLGGLLLVLWLLVATSAGLAQTTGFTYQGRLTDGGTAANGNYDLQFALWDSLSNGTQVGSTQTLNTVAVSNGVFTVSLEFGANAFPGANRFLEISARPSGAGSFTLLTPRQPITSTPYAVRSLNAASADSVPASGVPAGSGNYIQNTSTQQAPSNFNISGNGTAAGTLAGNVVNATTQYNLGGNRILSNAGTSNLFAGVGAGNANTGGNNSFFGRTAGVNNTTGGGNSFFGTGAGFSNTTGITNSFFGSSAGSSNTTGGLNSFFGSAAGSSNTTGDGNSFFGNFAGSSNTNGSNNTFIGNNTKIIGLSTSPEKTTLLGDSAAVQTGLIFNPINATAIGANALVSNSNSLVLGSINGINGATADTNVGIGTTAPTARLHVVGTAGLIGDVGIGTTSPTAKLSVIATGDGARVLHLGTERAWVFRQIGTGAATALELTIDNPANPKDFIITGNNVGIGTTAPDQKLSVNGNASKVGGGSWASFSDERLKNIKGRFTPGLNAVMQLQPLRYEYKRDNALNLKSEGEHVGFSAQAIQKIIPEAVSTNDKGFLLVNNDPILWTMLNAIKELKAENDALQQVNSTLNARLHKVELTLRKKSSASRRR
jgi:hypothetical protein